MKKLYLTIACLLALAGCKERENPLLGMSPQEVQGWLAEHESPAMVNCASLWAAPQEASAAQLESCAATAQGIVQEMNKSGFSNQEVLAEDLHLPAIWKTFLIEQAKRVAEREKSKQRLKRMRDTWGY